MDIEKLRALDPFYQFDRLWDKYVGVEGPLKTIADIAFTLVVAAVFYWLLGLFLGTPRPAVIVASTSMEPTLYPGDVVIVRGIPPEQIVAPEVELNIWQDFRVLPEQAGITFVRRGIELVAIEVNGTQIPVEENGTIIVYYDDLKGRDIIHRVILKIRTPSGYFFITKGDNDTTNPTADQDCIAGRCVYPFLVSEEQVLGTPLFVIPRIGLIKLVLFGGA